MVRYLNALEVVGEAHLVRIAEVTSLLSQKRRVLSSPPRAHGIVWTKKFARYRVVQYVRFFPLRTYWRHKTPPALVLPLQFFYLTRDFSYF